MSKQSKSKTPETGGPSFEDALGEIEAIIERIEAGEVGLEQSLTEYERGVSLINICRAKLDRARQQVEDLTRKLDTADSHGPGADAPGSGRREGFEGDAEHEV